MFSQQDTAQKAAQEAISWLAPVALAIGLLFSLLFHFNLAAGLLFGWIIAFVQATRHYPWPLVLQHSIHGARSLISIAFALVLIAVVLGLWDDSGVIHEVTDACRLLIHPNNVVWIGYLATAILSMIMGSSIATWSILVPPIMALASPRDSLLLAGALVSGAMVGDRTSPMSTSLLVMSKAAAIPHFIASKQAIKSAILPFLFAGLLFYIANRFVAPTSVLGISAPVFKSSQVWLLIAPISVIVLAILRVPLLFNFLLAFGLATLLAWFHPTTHTSLITIMLFGDKTASNHLGSSLGGLLSMVSLFIIIVAAGAFQGITSLTQVTERLTASLFAYAKGPVTRTWSTFFVAISFSLLMGSQSLAILMTGNALLPQLGSYQVPNINTFQILADVSELLPALIPWNILGLQASTILSISAVSFMPFVWYIWITILFCFLRTWKVLSRYAS